MPPSFRGLLIHEAWPLSLSRHLSLSYSRRIGRDDANFTGGAREHPTWPGIREHSSSIDVYHDDLSGYWTTTGVRGGGNTTTRHYVGIRWNDINIGLIYRGVKESKYRSLVLYIFPRECNRYYFKNFKRSVFGKFPKIRVTRVAGKVIEY